MKGSWRDQIRKSTQLFSQYWGERSSKQKGLIIGTLVFLMVALSAFVFFASRPQYVPLYTGQLSAREVGDIKAELDGQGYTDYKLSDTGNMLLVPKKDAADLVVTLASAGYPKDTSINYDVFSQNLSFGATDRQYDILEREAMQNQLAEVIKHVDGIENAKVILNLPEESVFIKADDQEAASASVMVEVKPGAKLDAQQIKALYTLVSRSVKNLPVENITIMNQYSETLALDDEASDGAGFDKFDEQRKVQQNVERDIQQNLQKLLGTILGNKQVYVQTFVKMNFDKVKTQESLVKPAGETENGLVISSEKNSKKYTGNGAGPGGVVGTGETDVPGYTANENSGNGNYDESQEKINYEVNRINNEIINSPYKIDDITINVGVEGDPATGELPATVQENIQKVAANVVRTALGHPEMTNEEIEQRVMIVPQSFAKEDPAAAGPAFKWIWIGAGAAALILLGALIYLLVRSRKQKNEPGELEVFGKEFVVTHAQAAVSKEPDYFPEPDMTLESQLKKLLEKRPEDFAKIIRTWLHDEEA